MIFGAARGLLLIMAMIVLAGFTPLPKDSWWKESKTIPFFQHLTTILTPYFPEAMRRYLNFDEQAQPLMIPNKEDNAQA
jgi:membrane protein required for colicin V production